MAKPDRGGWKVHLLPAVHGDIRLHNGGSLHIHAVVRLEEAAAQGSSAGGPPRLLGGLVQRSDDPKR
ncbi:hypothetical protein D1872_343230 [compost metagenome]